MLPTRCYVYTVKHHASVHAWLTGEVPCWVLGWRPEHTLGLPIYGNLREERRTCQYAPANHGRGCAYHARSTTGSKTGPAPPIQSIRHRERTWNSEPGFSGRNPKRQQTWDATSSQPAAWNRLAIEDRVRQQSSPWRGRLLPAGASWLGCGYSRRARFVWTNGSSRCSAWLLVIISK